MPRILRVLGYLYGTQRCYSLIGNKHARGVENIAFYCITVIRYLQEKLILQEGNWVSILLLYKLRHTLFEYPMEITIVGSILA